MRHAERRRLGTAFRALVAAGALLCLCGKADAGAAKVVSPCVPAHLSAAGRDADECAGIFAPVGVGTLKNQAAALNGTDGTGIGPLWGGDWEELAFAARR